MSKKTTVKLLNTSRMSTASNIQKNSIFEARVRSLADTGNAVVDHPSGLLFFVVGAWVGELITVRVQEVKSKFGLGAVVKVIEACEHRIQPPCGYHGSSGESCGGCSWMFVDYTAQLQAKYDRVAHAIARFDNECAVKPILPAMSPLGYRVRAQLKTNGRELGFVANGKRELVAVDDCLILTDKNRTTITGLKAKLPNQEWVPSSRKKQWTTLDIDESVDENSVSVNRRLPFKQANEQQNEAMKLWLANVLSEVDHSGKVIELFAGSGNFTEVLSKAGFESIVAVEVVDDAVTVLADRSLPGVEAVACDLFQEDRFDRLLKKHKDAKTLVLDPPRDGLKEKAGLIKKSSKIRNIVYISCDLATLCRDLRDFIDAGFRLIEVQPLDLMPQTPHVEVLTYLRKGK